MSGYVVHTYGPSGKYQDLHVCLKAASGWAFDYIIKFVNYGNSGNCSMESVVYYACKSIVK